MLDRAGETDRYRTRPAEIKERFTEEFLLVDLYSTSTGIPYRQTSNVFPLAFGMVPDSHRTDVARRLIDEVRAQGHLDTGFFGTRHLLQVLSNHVALDLAYDLVDRADYPG